MIGRIEGSTNYSALPVSSGIFDFPKIHELILPENNPAPSGLASRTIGPVTDKVLQLRDAAHTALEKTALGRPPDDTVVKQRITLGLEPQVTVNNQVKKFERTIPALALLNGHLTDITA